MIGSVEAKSIREGHGKVGEMLRLYYPDYYKLWVDYGKRVIVKEKENRVDDRQQGISLREGQD